MHQSCQIPAEEPWWANAQKEERDAVSCCGGMDGEIDRVTVQLTDGRKETFQFGSMEEARELLEKLQQARPRPAGFALEDRRALQG